MSKKIRSEGGPKNTREYRRRRKQGEEVEKALTIRDYFSRPVRWGKKMAPMLVLGDPSKLSNSKRRSNPLLDRVILQQLAKKMECGGVFALTAERPRPVPNRTKSRLNKIKRFSAARTLSRHARAHLSPLRGPGGERIGKGWRVHVPNWSHTSEVIKLAAYGASIPDRNRYTLNLDLSQDVIDMGLRSKRGFAKFMQDRISRELRKTFPSKVPGFLLIVEGTYDLEGVTALIPFHLHGAIEVPDVVRDGEVIEIMSHDDDVAEALRRAGGKSARSRQVKMVPMYNISGWFDYLSKSRLVTHHALKSARRMDRIPGPNAEGIAAATNSLKTAGRRWFEGARLTETQFKEKPRRKRRTDASI